MKTIVLLHGAWHGAWCWNKVTPILQSARNKVITPDIPWYSNSKPSKNISSDYYINSICKVIISEDAPVILIGHSMGGMVISQIAESIPSHIQTLIYVTGFLLRDGQCINDTEPIMTGSLVTPNLKLTENKKNIYIPDSIIRDAFYNDCDTADFNFAKQRIQPQSVFSFISPINISNENFGTVPRIYIECLQDRAIPIFAQRKMQQGMECQKVFSLISGHAPFFSIPDKLAEIMLSI